MPDTLQKPIKEFMTKKVMTVGEDESIKNVFKIMDKHGILGVPVVNDDQKVIGMITESDLIEHFTTLETPKSIALLGSILYLDDLSEFNKNLKEHCSETVKDLMNKEVITIDEEASLLDAINLMSEKDVNRLPVLNNDETLAGIVTRTDMVHQLAKL